MFISSSLVIWYNSPAIIQFEESEYDYKQELGSTQQRVLNIFSAESAAESAQQNLQQECSTLKIG